MEFRVVYLDENGYGHKGGFKSDKEANDWARSQTQATPIRLLVWSEEIQCFRKLYDF